MPAAESYGSVSKPLTCPRCRAEIAPPVGHLEGAPDPRSLFCSVCKWVGTAWQAEPHSVFPRGSGVYHCPNCKNERVRTTPAKSGTLVDCPVCKWWAEIPD